MDGPGFSTDYFADPLSSLARRRGQHHRAAKGLEGLHQHPNRGGLTRTRSAGEYEAAAECRGPHRCPLLGRQLRRARFSREPGVETRRRYGGATAHESPQSSR